MTIDTLLPDLRSALGSRLNVVLQAPPGAGKSTRVPLVLLDEPWMDGRRIVMLEPRRLAARAVAARMAATLGQEVGRLVGYRMRLDTRVGPSTRIEVVTDGVMTRMLHSDPSLDGIGLLIFDEFHERSLQADLSLALALQSQSLLRDDLRILVTSATLDGTRVASLLGEAPVIRAGGRSFPVEIRYVGGRRGDRVEPMVTATIRRALREEGGDLLVFLPGAREIHRVATALQEGPLPNDVSLYTLHGSLPQDEQDRVIAPSPPGRRKVVLSTSIAETSLTIEGVRVVIDSGLMRLPRFSPRSGMTRLETTVVSRSSADQRSGRAGRLGPGVSYRLWNASDHLLPFSPPEIVDADLAPLALDLAAWGAEVTGWLDPPPAPHLAKGRELLRRLGALDQDDRITPHGRRMAQIPAHPRLAHMMLVGVDAGRGKLACDLAALLTERDIVRWGVADVDITSRLEILRASDGARHASIDRRSLMNVRAQSRAWRRLLDCPDDDDGAVANAGPLLASAYPDRVAMRRGGADGRYLMRNGRGLFIDPSQPLARSLFVVAAETDGVERESRLFLGASVTEDDMEEVFGPWIMSEDVISWDHNAGRILALRRQRLGALILRERPLRDPDRDLMRKGLIEGVRKEGLSILPWGRAGKGVRERILFMRGLEPNDWPDASDEGLTATLEEWLAPWLDGMRCRDDLERLDLADILLGSLDWAKRCRLEREAPTHIVVPSGSGIAIDYSEARAPVLAVRLQEVFGMTETPRIAAGRVPLTMHLLSPAGRPAQVTRDLASFWRDGYFQARKDLRGRYPKHYWPDDPLVAEATKGRRR